jgi:hypothetical protein
MSHPHEPPRPAPLVQPLGHCRLFLYDYGDALVETRIVRVLEWADTPQVNASVVVRSGTAAVEFSVAAKSAEDLRAHAEACETVSKALAEHVRSLRAYDWAGRS